MNRPQHKTRACRPPGEPMDKEHADRLISQYQNLIFGFALKKMRNISQAEELAADIVCEVYLSFLRADEIVNTDGYVYRIARNVYARQIYRLSSERNFTDISELSLPCPDNPFERLVEQETLTQLRQEIGFLSERQRTILYLYYYEDQSVASIAERLHISPGTVKWHLSDARTSLKEELTMEKTQDVLSVNPILFSTMGHSGSPGKSGDTADFFDTRLKQNIAWYCYHTPHTVPEIARALNVPAVYIADEIHRLEDFGYLDRIDRSANPAYRTNMVIYDDRIDNSAITKQIHEAAARLCDELYPALFEAFENDPEHWGFICGSTGDVNYMKYQLVMLIQQYLVDGLVQEIYQESKEDPDWWNKYTVERPDGGNFIAMASVTDDIHPIQTSNEDGTMTGYLCCGYMNRSASYGKTKLISLQVDCRFCSRTGRWRDNLMEDWDALARFIDGGCLRKALSPEDYKRLCDKGYLKKKPDGTDELTLMRIQSSSPDMEDFLRTLVRQKAPLNETLRTISNELDDTVFKLQEPHFPPHILPIIRHYNYGIFGSSELIPHLIEIMLERGMLQPLTEEQKQTVFTLVTLTNV